MRKIEQDMVQALKYGKPFHGSNTTVHTDGRVFLHGNNIGMYHGNGLFTVNVWTLANYPTVTTKSRLRAIGVNVTTKNYATYLDGIDIGVLIRRSHGYDCGVTLLQFTQDISDRQIPVVVESRYLQNGHNRIIEKGR